MATTMACHASGSGAVSVHVSGGGIRAAADRSSDASVAAQTREPSAAEAGPARVLHRPSIATAFGKIAAAFVATEVAPTRAHVGRQRRCCAKGFKFRCVVYIGGAACSFPDRERRHRQRCLGDRFRVEAKSVGGAPKRSQASPSSRVNGASRSLSRCSTPAGHCPGAGPRK